MAIPETWAQTKATERITSQGREVVNSWRGRAGVSGANINTLIGEFDGWSSVSIVRPRPQSDGDGDAEVDITFAVAGDGTIRPDTDPDYGLVRRTWTRHANAVQESLLTHPRVAAEMVPIDADWPWMIKAAADAYNKARNNYIKHWIDDPPPPNSSPTWGPAPDPEDYLRSGSGTYYDSGSSGMPCAAWLFTELRQDDSATWDFDQYVLRKSEEVTSVSVLRASDTNVGRLLDYGALEASETTLPGFALLTSAGLETWVWLKKAPEIEAVAGGNFQITQEYWGFPIVTPLMEERYGAVITTP